MLLSIVVLLSLAAIYCGTMWLCLAISFWPHRHALQNSPETRYELQQQTFHLGLCFILTIGFLGIILTQGAV